MTKTIDFERFRAERAQEPVEFKIGTETYHLPPALPAALAIELISIRKLQNEDEDVSFEMLNNVGSRLFGSETWGALLDKHQITTDELPLLVKEVLAAYATPEESADPPKA